MGYGKPAFSGNAKGGSKGNMYGEAGRGRGQGRGGGRGGGGGDDWKPSKSRLQMAQEEDALESTLGYANFTEGDERLGWLTNVCAVRTLPRSSPP
jgi:DNA polymerase epsilon subunit 1